MNISYNENDNQAFVDSSILSDNYYSDLKRHFPAEVVCRLAQKYWDKQRTVALSLGEDPRVNVHTKTIKTIGIYYCQIACGGADRVVLDQAKMLSKLGYHIVLITETPLEDGVYSELPGVSHILLSPFFWDTNASIYPQRAHTLERCLVEYSIDLVVYNQSLSPLMLWDLLIIKAHGVSCIAWAHGLFAFPLTEIGKANGVDHRIADMPFVIRLADAVVCANRADKTFWSYFNTTVRQTIYTPNNNSIDLRRSNEAPQCPHIAWVGRFSSEKKPLDAIRIMNEVVKTLPNAVLDMVGPYDEEWFKKASTLIDELSLTENVLIHGRQNNMAPYYHNASVLLHTSQSESFCLVLLEAKAAGLPCVMYELPYLQLAEQGKAGGVLSARQNDVKTAAALCVQILTDKTLAQELSEASKQNAESLLAYDQSQFWQELISTLYKKREVKALKANDLLVLNTLCDTYIQTLENIDAVNLNNEITIARLHQEMNGLRWEIGKLHESLSEQQLAAEHARQNLHTIETSTTFRAGRTLLWLPTRLKDALRHKKS